MFGTEERHERDARSSQSHQVADAIRIHAGLVRHQPDPAAADQVKTVGQQDLDAWAYPIPSGAGSRRGGAANTRPPDSR